MLRAASEAAMPFTARTIRCPRSSNSLRNCATSPLARCVSMRSNAWRVLSVTSHSTSATEATTATVKTSSRRVRKVMAGRLPPTGFQNATRPEA